MRYLVGVAALAATLLALGGCTSAPRRSVCVQFGYTYRGATVPALICYRLEEDDTAPDLFGARPGEKPQLLYDNPERDSRLEVVGGDGSRFVFVEYNTRAFGRGVRQVPPHDW